MNEEFKKYKDSFMKNNSYCRELSSLEYSTLSPLDKQNCRVEQTGVGFKYHKKYPLQLTSEELDLFFKMKQYETNEEMNKKQGTMKNIMIFWMILTIINLIGSFIVISKIGSIFN